MTGHVHAAPLCPSAGRRSNTSMQTLSVVSTVFLPITFIAGVYGTNFVVLPELQWQLGYMYFWLLCTGITLLVMAIMWGSGMLAVQLMPLFKNRRDRRL